MGRKADPNSPSRLKKAELDKRREEGTLSRGRPKAGTAPVARHTPAPTKKVTQLSASQIRQTDLPSVLNGITPNGWCATKEELEEFYKDLAKQPNAPDFASWG